MGYQPSLDGLRALSVGVVLLYHAGFSWMHGGFFGVEVFFVVSGFLITSLLLVLLDETDRSGQVSFRQFWLRRARRLFPALYAVLLAVGVGTALWGSAEQQSQVRREIPWSILYVNNWGQILGNVPYFAGEPSPLRHLWSLAVEEQWYLIWPLVFVALMRVRLPRHVVGSLILGAAVAVWIYTFWIQSRSPTLLGGPPAAFDGVDRTNYMYLSTITRSAGSHPSSRSTEGKRSYGLYLWSWPIFVYVGATNGSVAKFVWAMLLTVVIAEASYRYLETPVRRGIIGTWWKDRSTVTYWPLAGGAVLVGALLLFYVSVDQFNRFEGGDDAVFDLTAAVVDDPVTASEVSPPAGSTPAGSTADASTVPSPSPVTTAPVVPASSGAAGDRRRLPGECAGDQPARRHRGRVPRGRQRQRRRVQRVRLGFRAEFGEFR